MEKHIMCRVRLNPMLLTDINASLFIEAAFQYMIHDLPALRLRQPS